MLQSLYVKNLALIDEAELEFKDGFSILSGETGAGKSIIIDSISFALGEKVDKSMVRDAGIPAVVQLVFSDVCEEAKAYLTNNDLDEADEIILTRKITDSKTVAKINGESVTAAKLRELAGLLIDIHGQSEHQSLLRASTHLGFVDSFANSNLADVKTEVSGLYARYKSLLSSLDEMSTDDELRGREKSFLEYEINEISEANLAIGEDNKLEEEYKLLTSFSKIYDSLSAVASLTGDRGALEAVSSAIRELNPVASFDERLSDLLETLTTTEDLLSDFNRQLSKCSDEMVFDEERLYEVENRLNLINGLKSKHGASIEAIFSALDEKQRRLSFLDNYEENIRNLKAQLNEVENSLKEACDRLTKLRISSASELEKNMTEALKELNFLQVSFKIQMTESKVSANGADAAAFMISLNPGEELKPLTNVASGGELSRIMLALKSCLAKNDSIGTLIFDEIDTGISGVTAQKVAAQIGRIATSHQVICITHLPQIAAVASHNYYIEKNVCDGKTLTSVRMLTDDERVLELARMMSGSDVTDAVLETARQMLNNHNRG